MTTAQASAREDSRWLAWWNRGTAPATSVPGEMLAEMYRAARLRVAMSREQQQRERGGA